jgi:hypothetical protein
MVMRYFPQRGVQPVVLLVAHRSLLRSEFSLSVYHNVGELISPEAECGEREKREKNRVPNLFTTCASGAVSRSTAGLEQARVILSILPISAS